MDDSLGPSQDCPAQVGRLVLGEGHREGYIDMLLLGSALLAPEDMVARGRLKPWRFCILKVGGRLKDPSLRPCYPRNSLRDCGQVISFLCYSSSNKWCFLRSPLATLKNSLISH